MIYKLANKRTEILPLATFHIAIIAHLYDQVYFDFALLISLPSFKSIDFLSKET